jgi:formamidopyrimidine-DNA glycosylase
MPELPEVETVVRQLNAELLGRTVEAVSIRVDSFRGEPVDQALTRLLPGRRIVRFFRRGKFIVGDFHDDTRLLLHLGMTGTFRICAGQDPVHKHEHIVFSLADGSSWRFIDPRRFGMIRVFPPEDSRWPPASLREMGPEPLEGSYTSEYLFEKSRKRKVKIKVFLLDQHIVAGIGNIYASEILFRSGIRPGKAAGRLTRNEYTRIIPATRSILQAAIEAGGTTIGTYTDVEGDMGRFKQQLLVYGRGQEPCLTCGTTIKQTVLGGRSTFYCPVCQA